LGNGLKLIADALKEQSLKNPITSNKNIILLRKLKNF